MTDKKILQDEMLSDEQLENVAGGATLEALVSDLRFLNVLNNSIPVACCDPAWVGWNFNDAKKNQIKAAWASVGIEVDNIKLDSRSSIIYKYKGKVISSAEAREIAIENVFEQKKKGH